jgi:hypothetical protein
MRLCRLVLMAAVLACPGAAAADEPPALAEARAMYNAGRYDAAIRSAATVREQAQFADAAALVIARSHLERFRLQPVPSDLTTAREMLVGIRAGALSPRDQVDLLIGLGQTLYLGEAFGAAAGLFETALSRATVLNNRDRLLLLDWWASAIDREALTRPPEGRAALFASITARMQDELRLDAGNPVANYWLAVAARGEGDPERAWDAAVAAWVRSQFAPPDAIATLRMDLDRLVTQAIIPDRIRQRPAREQLDSIDLLRAEWEKVKADWPLRESAPSP